MCRLSKGRHRRFRRGGPASRLAQAVAQAVDKNTGHVLHSLLLISISSIIMLPLLPRAAAFAAIPFFLFDALLSQCLTFLDAVAPNCFIQCTLVPLAVASFHFLSTLLWPCSFASIASLLLQTFIKVANYQHIMPTRYTLDVDLKSVVTQEAVENSSKRTEARKVSLRMHASHS